MVQIGFGTLMALKNEDSLLEAENSGKCECTRYKKKKTRTDSTTPVQRSTEEDARLV